MIKFLVSGTICILFPNTIITHQIDTLILQMTPVGLREMRYKNQGHGGTAEQGHCFKAGLFAFKVRGYFKGESMDHPRNIVRAQDFHSSKQGEDPPLLHLRSKSHVSSWQCRCVQAETVTGPGPSQCGCMGLRTHFLGPAGRKSSVNFLSLTEILRVPLGSSIRLQIYPKLSKFTMTNVTVPLNWSSSLGSFGGLERMPATRTGKEINL